MSAVRTAATQAARRPKTARAAQNASQLADEADFYDTLPAAIAKAGGRERILACGPVFTGPFHVQVLAWHLKLHGGDIEIAPKPPGIIMAAYYSQVSRDRRFQPVTRTRWWVVRRACAP